MCGWKNVWQTHFYALIGILSCFQICCGFSTFPKIWKLSFTKLKLNVEDAYCFDEAVIFVRGGSGGPGSSAAKFGKNRQHLAPFGGSGGNGGSVFLQADPSLNTLRSFGKLRSFRAENGHPGDKEYRTGMTGANLDIKVPYNTLVFENSTNALIGELTGSNPRLLVAEGGRGGLGNAALSKNGERMGAAPPQAGEKRFIRLELQLLADVGLIGYPNAGKSTLLKAITNANPKIADYAFTTLVPNLGVLTLDDKYDRTLVVADIPGLIEGAHAGVGLGRDFLKHIEKCKILVHLISGCSQHPEKDYLAINRELVYYSPLLASKPQVVVLNKLDLEEVNNREDELMASLRLVLPHSRLLSISALNGLGISELKSKLWDFYGKILRDSSSPGNSTFLFALCFYRIWLRRFQYINGNTLCLVCVNRTHSVLKRVYSF